MFLDRIQTQEEIHRFIEEVYGDRKRISFEEFQHINEHISSEMFLAVTNTLRTYMCSVDSDIVAIVIAVFRELLPVQEELREVRGIGADAYPGTVGEQASRQCEPDNGDGDRGLGEAEDDSESEVDKQVLADQHAGEQEQLDDKHGRVCAQEVHATDIGRRGPGDEGGGQTGDIDS